VISPPLAGNRSEAVARLQSIPSGLDQRLLEALGRTVAERTAASIQQLPIGQLRAGMVLAEDVRSRTGVLLVARGQTVSAGLLARLLNLAQTVKEPLRVVVPDASTSWDRPSQPPPR